MTARIKQCPTCLGEAVVYEGHAIDELRGGSYQRWIPCPNRECDDGWIDDDEVRSSRPVLVVLAIAIVVLSIAALLVSARPASGALAPIPALTSGGPVDAPLSGAPNRTSHRGGPGPRADEAAAGAPLPAQGQVGTPLIAGGANFAEPGHGPDYLAMRLPRHTRVRICGAGSCRVMVTNDVGPKSRAKVADIALVRFTAICGFPDQDTARRAGICAVEIEVLGHLAIALPPTDTED